MTELIRIIRSGNPLYPLPADYHELDTEGQRQARVNGCRQWMVRSPHYDPVAWWASYTLFDTLYLREYETSYFYDDAPTVWGPQQRHLLENAAVHNKLIVVWPRGFTKTTTLAVMNLMLLTGKPRNKVFYLTSTVKKARDHMIRRCMKEWETNDGLIMDFAVGEYGAPARKGFRPGRDSSDSWSAYSLHATLCNGSSLIGGGVDAATRGERAPFIELDDPEKDFKTATDTSKARAYLESFIFKTLKPVLNRRSLTRLIWAGTRISPRHYLYEATHGDDPRFDYWKKSVFMAATPSFNDRKKALWPEHMSLNEITQEIKESGPAYVLSEYFNEPGQSINVSLRLEKEHHNFDLIREDGSKIGDPFIWDKVNPYDNDLRFSYKSPKTGEPVIYGVSDLITRSVVVQTNDWAKSLSRTADFSCTLIGVYGPEGELLALDGAIGKWMPSERSDQVLKKSYLWRPDIVAFEAFSAHHEIMVRAHADYAEASAKLGYRPRLKRIPIHGGGSKSDKVHAIAWRFGDANKIEGYAKFPFWMERKNPVMAALFSQIRECNFESADLGLPHDDAIDTYRMLQDAVGFRPGQIAPSITLAQLTAREKLLSGNIIGDDGIPLIERVGLENLTPAEEDEIVDAIERTKTDRKRPARGFRYL